MVHAWYGNRKLSIEAHRYAKSMRRFAGLAHKVRANLISLCKSLKYDAMTKELEDSTKESEIEEIQRRIDYLINTDQISSAEKAVIVTKALRIIEQSQTKEVVL
jgi:hypothetical protein